MATYLDGFKLGVEGHTPEANDTRRQAAVARLEEINSLGADGYARADDRAGVSLVVSHGGDLQKVLADDMFNAALADRMTIGPWPRSEDEVLETAENVREQLNNELASLEIQEAPAYHSSPEFAQDLAQMEAAEARAQEREEAALDYAEASNEDYWIARQETLPQRPGGTKLTADEVSFRLMRAYGEGTDQRLDNAATMSAIMNGQQPETGLLAQRQLDAMADIERAQGFFPPNPARIASEGGRRGYEHAAIDALETALRGIGEWEGLSLPVTHEADRLFTNVGYYSAEYEDMEHLWEIVPNLEKVRETVSYRNGTMFGGEFDNAARTGREYAVHQLKASAGPPVQQSADQEQEPKNSLEIKPAARNETPATEASPEPLEAGAAPGNTPTQAQQTTEQANRLLQQIQELTDIQEQANPAPEPLQPTRAEIRGPRP